MVRVKYRYLVAQIEPDVLGTYLNISTQSIYECIINRVQKFYGDYGVALVRNGLRCKYCNKQTRIAIIRIKHDRYRFVASVLPLINTILSHSIRFKTLYKGATIMQCDKFIIKYHQQSIDHEIGNIESAAERHKFIKNINEFKTIK